MRRRLALVPVVAAVAASAAYFLIGPRRRPHRDPRFVTLGELAADLAGDPKTFDAVLETIGAGRTAVGLVPGAERLVLRRLFEAADYGALDGRPRVTLEELATAVNALAARAGPRAPAPLPPAGREPLGISTGRAAPTGEPFLADLGLGLRHGDRIDPQKARRFRDSERFAELLDRLALNRPGAPGFEVDLGDGAVAATPEALAAALGRAGHAVVVHDERFAANFGDLEHDGLPVATPLWTRTGVDDLVVPVPHVQVTLLVRGPRVNADASLYNGLDLGGGGGGGTRFRAEVTRDQPWVGARVAHAYEGAEALEAVRLMGLFRRAADDKVRARRLPLDGYFAAGVCTLAPAVVERALLGRTTIWPLVHDPALFDGEAEIDRIVRALPVDGRGGPPPEPARVFASLPWRTAEEVPFPALREALRKAGWVGG